MSKPAAIPFFGDAYLADTTHLTTEEHGAYFLLLLAAWRQEDCGLPNDDKKLARIAGLATRKWTSIKPTIMEFWAVENGRIYHTAAWASPQSRKTLSPLLKRAIVERDRNRCAYCGTDEGPFEFDHIYPWSRGGKDTLENLCVACWPCNRAKGDRTPQEMGWAQ